MEPLDVKIIISGLDNAGKTSILTALDKKYDFQKEIAELKPTIRIEYHQTMFLGNNVNIWDMGGQEQYRELYESYTRSGASNSNSEIVSTSSRTLSIQLAPFAFRVPDTGVVWDKSV